MLAKEKQQFRNLVKERPNTGIFTGSHYAFKEKLPNLKENK